MSEVKKENKSVDTNSSPSAEIVKVNEEQLKINDRLKDRLRKYIKNLDGKIKKDLNCFCFKHWGFRVLIPISYRKQDLFPQ